MAIGSSTIRLTALTKRFGSHAALDDVNITVRSGSLTAILGPSGSGKSTLLMAIAGFQQPDKGGVFVDDVDISGWPAEKRGIGVVFQGYAIFPHMSVANNIAFPLRARRMKRLVIDEKVRKVARLMEIEELLPRLPSEISGGQRQRVAIARALVFEPSLLLLDEPFSALDRNLRDRMKEELRRVHQQLGVTIIMVTHDQDEATELADTIIVMEKGRVIANGNPKVLYDDPPNTTVAAFFGRANLLDVTHADDQTVIAGGTRFDRRMIGGQGGRLLIRPEALLPNAEADASSCIELAVESVRFRSGRYEVVGKLPTGEALSVEVAADPFTKIVSKSTIRLQVMRGFLLD